MATERFIIEIRAKGTRRVKRDLDSINRSAQGARKTLAFLRAALVVVASARIAKQFLDLADVFTLMRNRIRLLTKDTRQLNAVQNTLFKISQETRTSFEANATLFTRMTRATGNLGLNFGRLLDITRGLSQAVAIGGSTVQESTNAMIQFSQALAAGALTGDELRSVTEQLPVLAQIIAKEFGLAAGQLITFAKTNDRALKTERIIKAIEDALPGLAKAFATTQSTIGQGFERVNNALIFFIGKVGAASGIGALFANTLNDIANNIGLVLAGLLAITGIIVFNLLISQVGKFIKLLVSIPVFITSKLIGVFLLLIVPIKLIALGILGIGKALLAINVVAILTTIRVSFLSAVVSVNILSAAVKLVFLSFKNLRSTIKLLTTAFISLQIALVAVRVSMSILAGFVLARLISGFIKAKIAVLAFAASLRTLAGVFALVKTIGKSLLIFVVLFKGALIGLVTVLGILKVAVLANPLFLLGALLIGAVVLAFVVFEDEIQNTIKAIKDMIPTFTEMGIGALATLDTIVDNWRNLPIIMKEIAIDAVNFLVKSFQIAGNKIIDVFNSLGGNVKPIIVADIIKTPREEVAAVVESQKGLTPETGPDDIFGGRNTLTKVQKFTKEFNKNLKSIEEKGLSKSLQDRLETLKELFKTFTLGGLDADEMEKLIKEYASLQDAMNGVSGVTQTLQTRFDKLVDKFNPVASAARKVKEALEAIRAVDPGRAPDEIGRETGVRQGISDAGAKLIKAFKRDLVGVGNEAEITKQKIDVLKDFQLNPKNGITDGELDEQLRILNEDLTIFKTNIDQINLAGTFDPAIDLAEQLRVGLVTLNSAERAGNATIITRAELVKRLTRESLGLDNEQVRMAGTTKNIDAALKTNSISMAEAVVLRKNLAESTRLFNAEQTVDNILAQTDAFKKESAAIKQVVDAFAELRAANGDASGEQAAIIRARREASGVGNEEFVRLKNIAQIRQQLSEQIITQSEATKKLIAIQESSSKFKAEQKLLSQVGAVNKLVAANKQLADIEREFDKLRTDGVGTEKEREEVLRRTIREIVGVGNATTDLAEKQELLGAALKQGAIDFDEFRRAMRDARIDFLETQTDFSSGFERGVLKARRDLEDFASAAESAVVGAFDSMKDALADFIETGEFSLEGFINTIRRSFAELAAQSLLNEALSGFEELFGIALPGGKNEAQGQGADLGVGFLQGGLTGASLAGDFLAAMQGASAFPGLSGGGGLTIGDSPPLTDDTIIPKLDGISDALSNLGDLFSSGLSSLLNLFSGSLGSLGGLAGLIGFRHGGNFTIPGPNTGIDDKLVAFRGSGGEQVTVTPTNQVADRAQGLIAAPSNINISRLVINTEQKDNARKTNDQIDRKATVGIRRTVQRGF